MAFEDCYRVCGDRSGLVLKKYGFRYSNVLFDRLSAIQRAISLDVKHALNFARGSFGVSRYSNGSWPVLYTATEDETSLHEVAYHAKREWLAGMRVGLPIPNYRTCKKLVYVVQVDASSQKIESMADPKLVADDYIHCHSIAASAKAAGFESLRVPSARRRNGVCIPVFEKSSTRPKTNLSFPCTIRWYPSRDRLVHYATRNRGGSPIDIWNS